MSLLADLLSSVFERASKSMPQGVDAGEPLSDLIQELISSRGDPRQTLAKKDN